MKLVLHQHLDELRRRGVDEDVLQPIAAELRRYDETVDQLVDRQADARPAKPAASTSAAKGRKRKPA
jgi:hypothetical protein